MKKDFYKLLSGAKLGLFAFALTLLSCTAYSQAVYTYSYTGGVQTVTLNPGNYKIESWGANGADGTYYSAMNPNNNISGGKGGYSVGTITVTSTIPRYVYVGGKGSNANAGNNPGGYNGGGNSSSAPYQAGSGGGASHVATSTGVLSTLSGNQGAVLIVGGGGGGGGNQSLGGDGGGLNGVTPPNNTQYANRTAGGGGTPSSGGACYSLGSGAVFGQGGTTSQNLAGGGGGGWYGGCTGDNSTGGGGGSGYVGGVNGGASYTLGAPGYSANPDISGHGRVVITELCSINLLTSNGGSIIATICSGQSLTLTTNAVSNYSWSNGGNTNSVLVTPSVTTIYTVTGTSTANCVSSAAITVSVASGIPTLAITNPSNSICPGKSVTLTANGAASYSWSGNVVNGVGFVPAVTAVYTATGSNACGSATASTTITVNPTPTISITASTASLCSGNTATIIAGGAGTYVISNGVQNGVSFMPQQTAVYTATGTSVLGCTSTAQTTITVVQTPTAFPGAAPALICFGGTSTISVGGAQGYTWSNGSNQPSFTDSPTITTVYTVTKTNGPCQDIKSVTLTVAPLPFILALTNPTVVCSLKQVTLNAGGAQTYTWAPFGGIGNGLVVTPTVTTIFTVTGNDGTCSNTGTVLLTVLPNPTISIAATSTVLCLGECATLTLGGASTYTWYTAGLTGTNVNQCPTGTTSYSVAGTNSVGCTTGNTKVLVVNPVPNVNVFTNKPMVCSGQGSTLTVNGANSYTWSTGPLGTISVVNPQTTSVYTVTGFLNGTGCNTTKTIQITVFSPTFQVPSTASSCIGGTVNLCASAADSYTWNGNFSFPCISVSPSVYTIYQVSATSTSLNINNSPVSCISSNTVGVSIYLNPTITIAASRTTICKGESTNLTGIGGTTFTWSTFQQGTTVPVSPFVQTTYTVLGADANGCQGTAAIQIKVGQCTGIDELSQGNSQMAVYPNPTTGSFIISISTVHDNSTIEIYNALGELILNEKVEHHDVQANLANKAAGIYIVRLVQNGKVMDTSKIIKQ